MRWTHNTIGSSYCINTDSENYYKIKNNYNMVYSQFVGHP